MNEKKIILFQGDSVTDCNRMREDVQTWNTRHRLGTGYACLSASELGYKYPDKNLSFINRGIAGSRIRDLYARMAEDMINLNPDIISILIGVNEVFSKMDNNTGTTEPDRFETIYRLMLEEIHQKLPKTKIILIEPFLGDVGDELKGGYALWKSYIEPLQDVVAKLAIEYGCAYIPMQDVFNDLCKNTPVTHWIGDGIHPTEAGHKAMTIEWVKTAEKLI